jgi:hypothetical protein
MKDEHCVLRKSSSFIPHPSYFRLALGAGDETRTRDPQLGRLMLYQLSYTRPQSNFGLRISHCGFSPLAQINPKSAFRNPKFFLVQGVGFEPT